MVTIQGNSISKLNFSIPLYKTSHGIAATVQFSFSKTYIAFLYLTEHCGLIQTFHC